MSPKYSIFDNCQLKIRIITIVLIFSCNISTSKFIYFKIQTSDF